MLYLYKEDTYFDLISGDVNHESLLALEELAHSEVFHVGCDWSDEIPSLRQLAIHKPHVITENYIFRHFKTLRLIDRDVCLTSTTIAI